jgi:polar amino acid transport system substrate-binding protein
MRRALRLVLALAALAAGSCDVGVRTTEVVPLDSSAKPLRVGMEIAYKPFEFVDETGKPAGFDVDLTAAVAKHLGRDVEHVNLGFDTLINELVSGRIDVICSGMSYTDERAKTVDFTRPYAGSPMWMLASTALVKNGASLDDLDQSGTKIAVQRGTTGEMKARARFKKAEFLVFGTQGEAGDTVATGRAHLFVYDKVTIETLHDGHKDTTRVLPGDLGQESYCMAVAKGSPLKAQIDAFLAAETKKGGKVDELLSKWVPGWEQYRVRDE